MTVALPSVATAPASHPQALLKTLRAALTEEWKTDVMGVPAKAFKHALAEIGFSIKEFRTYAPLLNGQQVTCLWLLELTDDVAVAAAVADVAGTDIAPREIRNQVAHVKVKLEEVDGTDKLGRPREWLHCSLSMLVPNFEMVTGAAPPSADPSASWVEHRLLAVLVDRAGAHADIAAAVQEKFRAAVSTENHPAILAEARRLVAYMLNALAP